MHRVVTLCSVIAPTATLAAKDSYKDQGSYYPVPTELQLAFMNHEMSQFMHYGINTYWKAPSSFLHSERPTYHNCKSRITGLSHDNQTKGYWPCLNPDVYAPTGTTPSADHGEDAVYTGDVDPDQWMAASAAMGMQEICFTAQHVGGFAMWPSNFTNYSIAASAWYKSRMAQRAKNPNIKSPDVLGRFVEAAKRWGIKICYYLNFEMNGYFAEVLKLSEEEYTHRALGMLREALEHYGPVNRFWFDGSHDFPGNRKALYHKVAELIRSISPDTLFGPYVGNGYTNTIGPTNYYTHGPDVFVPTESHGMVMQEGPNGNQNELPTYWFWHEWACARNISGCPWFGLRDPRAIFEGYLEIVGHGAVMNMNIAPDRTGSMNATVVEVMHAVGRSINETFGSNYTAKWTPPAAYAGSECVDGAVVLDVTPADVESTKGFDYVMIMEDVRYGQRVGNYSVEYLVDGNDTWQTLVPPVRNHSSDSFVSDPIQSTARDSHIGYKRVDIPTLTSSDYDAQHRIRQVRLNCLGMVELKGRPARTAADKLIHIRSLSLHKKKVQWPDCPPDTEWCAPYPQNI